MSDTKNPFAVNIGLRLKRARLMAGFNNVEQMLEHIPGWEDKRSRITNYEAGISMAPPEAILAISKATGCSPCWLMFESGPIRASGRDRQAIRHQNFSAMVTNAIDKRQLTQLLKMLQLSRKNLDEYLNNPFLEINDRLARRCEKFIGKRNRWMDEQHIESDPVCQSFPEDLRELMTIYSELDQQQQNKLLKIARVFTDK